MEYEHKFDKQIDYGFGLTLNMTGKAPAVSKRIFTTYDYAKQYIDNVNDSAIDGLILSVIADSDPEKNGAYFAYKAADGSHTGVLEKIYKKLVFDTLENAQAFVDNKTPDPYNPVVVGGTLSVVSDPVEKNNGLYFIYKKGSGSEPGKIEKAGREVELKVEDGVLIITN